MNQQSTIQPIVAVTDSFLEAYGDLSPKIRRSIRAFIERFQANPTSSSIDYEPLVQFKNKHLRSVRINREYRGVIYHPPEGNTYVFLWVAGHDEASQWAAGKQFDHLLSDALPWITVSTIDETEQIASALFPAEKISDRRLKRLQLPSVLIPAVRHITTLDGLGDLSDHLPFETIEALGNLYIGMPFTKVFQQMNATREKLDAMKQQNNADAEQTLTQDNLHPLPDYLHLSYQKPLSIWRITLHPDQQQLVASDLAGPARVLGGAGTGKTVVAMHRAHRLAQSVDEGKRVLFLTHTSQLCNTITHQLTRFPDEAAVARIDTNPLSEWMRKTLNHHLKATGNPLKIAKKDEMIDLWRRAVPTLFFMPFTTEQIRQEWEQVIRPNNITTEADYLAFARTGQGRPLNRDQREQVWMEIIRFQRALESEKIIPPTAIPTYLRGLIERGELTLPYQHVVIDEVQDFSPEALRLIRAMVPPAANDIFLVGDPYQRTEGFTPVPFKQCGLEIVGRSRTLSINYRTTDKIRELAEQILDGGHLPSMTNDEQYSRTDHISTRVGDDPVVKAFNTGIQERQYVVGAINRLLEKGIPAHEICIITRHATQHKKYQTWFTEHDQPFVYLKKGSDDDGLEKEGIRIATMHHVRGLEFAHVFISGVSKSAIPFRTQRYSAETLQQERQLLHIACTRARDQLTITNVGTPSTFLPLE